MTYPISDVTRRVVYSGSAGTGPYTFTFEVLTQGDIGVYKNSTLLTLTTDYTVTINVDGTGYITLVSAATAADTIAIFGNKGIQRSTDFVTGGDLFANSLNDELDAQTIFAQQNAEAIIRSIRAPQFDTTNVDMVLPKAADRADGILQFDTDGNPTVVNASQFVSGLSGSILGANYITNNATGDGSTVNFTLSTAPGAKGNLQIYIDGVYQNKASFSLSGTTVTFTEAPPLNASVEFIIGYSIGSTSGDATGIDFTQQGTGAVTTTVAQKLYESVSVKDFGAVGDGVTDDSTAIQAAFNACAISGKTLHFPPGTYNSSSTHTASGGFNIFMEGTMVYTGSSKTAFLTIDGGNGREHYINLQAATIDWSDDDFIGLHIYDVFQNTLYLQIRNFTVGARLGGDDQFAYSIVYPVLMLDNRIGLDLNNKGIGGYVNQNLFINGRFAVSSPDPFSSTDRVGVRITSETSNFYNNNNLFINSSFELGASNTTGGATSIPVLAEYAQINQFIGCRCEDGATGTAVVEKNNSYQNQYDFLYCDSSAASIDYQGNYRNSIFYSAQETTENINATGHLVFDSGPLYQRANLYDGSTTVFVDNVHWQGSSSSTPSASVDSVTINSDNLSFGTTRALGVFIDVPSSNQTKFLIQPKMKSGDCRLYIACFDSSGTRLTSSDPNAPYITGSPSAGVSYSSNYGGAYTLSPSTRFYFAIAKTDVAKIQILLAGESGELQDFIIYCNNVTNVYSGVNNLDRRQKLGTAVPTAGTWVAGDMVWNAAPSAGGTMGWVCVTGGTPGTWKTFGTIAA